MFMKVDQKYHVNFATKNMLSPISKDTRILVRIAVPGSPFN